MKLPNLKLLGVPPSPVRAMGGLLVGTRKVRPGISHTLLAGRDKNLQNLRATLVRICQPGRVLVPVVEAVVGAVEVPLTVVLEVPRTLNNTNDNYCVEIPVVSSRAVNCVIPQIQKTLNVHQNVDFSVVSPVHFATNTVKQPQKKGSSPLFLLSIIVFLSPVFQMPTMLFRYSLKGRRFKA